jgi:hypothetical protein
MSLEKKSATCHERQCTQSKSRTKSLMQYAVLLFFCFFTLLVFYDSGHRSSCPSLPVPNQSSASASGCCRLDCNTRYFARPECREKSGEGRRCRNSRAMSHRCVLKYGNAGGTCSVLLDPGTMPSDTWCLAPGVWHLVPDTWRLTQVRHVKGERWKRRNTLMT